MCLLSRNRPCQKFILAGYKTKHYFIQCPLFVVLSFILGINGWVLVARGFSVGGGHEQPVQASSETNGKNPLQAKISKNQRSIWCLCSNIFKKEWFPIGVGGALLEGGVPHRSGHTLKGDCGPWWNPHWSRAVRNKEGQK